MKRLAVALGSSHVLFFAERNIHAQEEKMADAELIAVGTK